MSLRDLQFRLCDRFGYRRAVLFGRARSAVTSLLDVLGMAQAPVLIPANVCPAVVNAVFAARARPVLLPVEAGSGLVADGVMASAVSGHGPGVAMPCHLYGFRAAMAATVAAARSAGWFVLENDSLATTAVVGRGAAAADACLVSFGYAKTMEAGGGGALLLDDDRLASELVRAASGYPMLDAEAEERERWFMETRRRLRAGPPGRGALRGAAEALVETELLDARLGFPGHLIAPVTAALDALDAGVASKRRVSDLWDAALAPFSEPLAPPEPHAAVPWRLIRVLEPGLRVRVVDALRAAGIDAGTNFPTVAPNYPTLLEAQAQPDPWGDSVLNLWLTDDYGQDRIAAATRVIARVIEGGGQYE